MLFSFEKKNHSLTNLLKYNLSTQFHIEFVVAGGGFRFYWNSKSVKIGKIRQCLTKNVGFLH